MNRYSMREIDNFIGKNVWILYLSAVILLIIALFMHLDYFPIFVNNDEATRGLVAMEMMFSGNYITPTIHGELYLFKPPLFNWVLAGFFSLSGSFDEFMLRLPSVLFLLLLGFLIWYFVQKEAGHKAGILTALVYLTTGRLIMFESFFCQIDMLFSCFVYAGMMSIYFLHKKQKYLLLFTVSYLLAAGAFLSKGLPGIVFHGITLSVFFFYKKEFKKFFSLQHIAGGLLFLAIVGGYYLLYFRENGSIEDSFKILWSESTQRTLVHYGVIEVIKNFLLFPLELLYHYAPWTIFIIYFFSRRFWKIVFGHPFLKFNFMVFIFNLLVYWTSPEVYPKYYMMLMPLFFTLPVIVYVKHYDEFRVMNRIIEIFFFVLGILVVLAAIGIAVFNTSFYIQDRVLKTIIISLFTGIFIYLYLKLPAQRLIIAVLLVLAGKFTYNWMNWVTRYPEIAAYRNEPVKAAKKTMGEELHFFNMGQERVLQYSTTYYMTAVRQQIIPNDRDTIIPGIFYVIEEKQMNTPHRQGLQDSVYMRFETKEQNRKLNLVKFYDEGLNPSNEQSRQSMLVKFR